MIKYYSYQNLDNIFLPSVTVIVSDLHYFIIIN